VLADITKETAKLEAITYYYADLSTYCSSRWCFVTLCGICFTPTWATDALTFVHTYFSLRYETSYPSSRFVSWPLCSPLRVFEPTSFGYKYGDADHYSTPPRQGSWSFLFTCFLQIVGLYRRRPGVEDSNKHDKYQDNDFDRDSYLDTILVRTDSTDTRL
jgi:hypothetical protein